MSELSVPAVDVTGGDPAGLARGEVMVDEKELKDKHLKIGDMLAMTFARTGNRQLRIAGTPRPAPKLALIERLAR